MNRRTLITAGMTFAALTIAGCAHMGSEWITLVDGDKGLENFNRTGDANWRTEGGAIVADKGKGGVLVSKSSYKDFELRAEFWAETTTNSGIYIRITDPIKVSSASGYEVQIYDLSPRQEYGTGALVNVATVNPVFKVGGKWNTYEIYAKGPEITVKLNGAVTVSTQNTSFAAGPIGLQFSNGPNGVPGDVIKWRKVQIRPL
mgnify:CR=1 FL=1